MERYVLSDLTPALPEIFLAGAVLVLLMFGVFAKRNTTRSVTWLTVAALAAALGLVVEASPERTTTFYGMFVNDGFAGFMKMLVLIGAGATLVMSMSYVRREGMNRFEFPILILFATIGMLMMISANDLIALYVGLELQSLALYVIAAFQRDTVRSSEAGLKYFVLGALSSGMLLYGSSLIYGFTGTTNFDGLAQALALGAGPSIGILVGLVFVLAGLAFKVSAVPFHMWTPDVYEGAPTAVTAFFAAAPKIAATGLLLRVLLGPFHGLVGDWQQIVIAISILSMLLGSFAAIGQTNIKRLMAYSSISHIGFALVGLSAGTAVGVRGVIVYMTIYMAMTLGTFACILAMRQKGRMVEGIADLGGLAKSNPLMALALAIFMFSMAGIPPLAGFFGKLYVFLAVIEEGLYGLAVIGVLSSVVSAFYYVRIVKVMYFDAPAEPFDRPVGREISLVVAGSGLFTVFFVTFATPILAGAEAAARALFP
ncbi:MAG: NADH-quinone oxidoreductase subunit NuoN [Proteobacteria bacterium]|nr:NADH-quinone oxidoreductase subunit NuoN [Pseudomonadota bacterium]